MWNPLRNLATLAVLAACLVAAGSAAAQSAYTEPLGGLEWGATVEQVLQHHRDRIMDGYRTQIAGLRDPLEIDRLRREAESKHREIVDSLETFDGQRTGYEVSVLQDEIAPGRDMSMVSVRDEWSMNYYVLVDGRLTKLIVTYDQASLSFLGFEGFVERLEAALGSPESTDWRVDDIGVRHMTRATWTDGTTRVRAEDKSRMFASYLVVYADASAPDTVAAAAGDGGAGANRPGTSRDLGSMIRGMESGDPAARDNSDVVDELIGAPVEVELRLRSDEEVYGPDGEGSAFGGSALDDDDELEDAERLERPRRSSSHEDEPAEEEEDGGIIY